MYSEQSLIFNHSAGLMECPKCGSEMSIHTCIHPVTEDLIEQSSCNNSCCDYTK